MTVSPLELGLALLEGMALIASPCILPVLPLILSGSLEGGKSRPFGIILGFIIAFSGFALGAAALVKSLHINLDLLKHLSLVFLTLFGFMLIFKPLSEWFEKLTAALANKGNIQPTFARDGLLSGLLIGSMIGLVWTPCAGPILAAALVQIIRQENSISSLLLVIAFAIGVGIPMLMIAITGREFIKKSNFLIRHATGLRKILGVLILISVSYFIFGFTLQIITLDSNKQLASPKEELINPLPIAYSAPEFVGIEGWLNTKPLTMADLKGKVVLIDFWTYSCINCIRTLPYLISWDKKYREAGLVIVGVHSPEFEFEKKESNIQAAINQFGIQYPVAIDNSLNTWQAYHNLYWPADYLIDKSGKVVYTHFGEGAYTVTEDNIRTLLNAPTKIALTPETTLADSSGQTPESYLGYFRFENFANAHYKKDASENYTFPTELNLHQWALNGLWKIEGQKSLSQSDNDALRLHFKAKKLFLVMGSANNKPLAVKILLNGKMIEESAGKDVKSGQVIVNEHRLYEIIQQPTPLQGLLELQMPAGLEIFAFTFGS